MMELVEIASNCHFTDTRIGSISRKQRLKIPAHIARELQSLNLVKIINPQPAVFQNYPRSAPQPDGGEVQSVSSPVDQVSEPKTPKQSRRGRPKKTGESSQ